jgi:hypothetical protein
MTPSQASALQDCLIAFAARSEGLRAMAVCGSWARGSARPDSDLDVLMLAREPQRWIAAPHPWLTHMGLTEAGFTMARVRIARYGVVTSLHCELRPTALLELSVAPEDWANVNPIDPGTRRVVSDGFRVLVDKDGALRALVAAIGAATNGPL